jgi:hypothetical protein
MRESDSPDKSAIHASQGRAIAAKQAKDYQMINDATDIRLRAEIRAGALLKKIGSR